MNFEWDDKKASMNLLKHGVAFTEAATAFADDYSMEIRDLNNLETEERWICLGRSNQNRLLVVVFCERIEATRIISARVATKNEKKYYAFRGIYER